MDDYARDFAEIAAALAPPNCKGDTTEPCNYKTTHRVEMVCSECFTSWIWTMCEKHVVWIQNVRYTAGSDCGGNREHKIGIFEIEEY